MTNRHVNLDHHELIFVSEKFFSADGGGGVKMENYEILSEIFLTSALKYESAAAEIGRRGIGFKIISMSVCLKALMSFWNMLY